MFFFLKYRNTYVKILVLEEAPRKTRVIKRTSVRIIGILLPPTHPPPVTNVFLNLLASYVEWNL